jgi:hypothetical protein
MSEPYRLEEMQRRHEEIMSRRKLVGGPFKVAGRRTAEVDAYNNTALSRKSLPDAVKALHKALVQDWAAANFSVAATLDDFVAVVFEEASVDSMPALEGYMRVLAETGEVCRRYLLGRVSETWGDRRVRPGQIWFLLRPPWVSVFTLCSVTSEILASMPMPSVCSAPPRLPRIRVRSCAEECGSGGVDNAGRSGGVGASMVSTGSPAVSSRSMATSSRASTASFEDDEWAKGGPTNVASRLFSGMATMPLE